MSRVDDAPGNRARSKRLRIRWLLLALLVPIGVVVAWLEPDEEDLFELCSTQGKPTIYRSVEAEGYFDGLTDNCWGCWRYLRNTDYKFIEFSLSKRRLDFDPIREPGIYRVSRINADSPECDKDMTAYYTKAETMRQEFERNNWCFQVERLDSRRARYGYYREQIGTVGSSPITGSSISANRFFFLDHQTEQILAESTDYGLAKYPIFQVSSFSSSKFCNDFADRLGVRGLSRQEVIKPGMERR